MIKLGSFTFDFTELGAPEEKVTMRDPQAMPWKRAKEVQTAIGSGDITVLERTLADLIESWTLTDEQGEVLPLPKEQPDVFDGLPVAVVNHLAKKFHERVEGSTPKNS